MVAKGIQVRTQFEGYHRWPEAPDEVAFLRNPHRHVFHVRLAIPITKDRETEFFVLRRQLDDVIQVLLQEVMQQPGPGIETSSISCEEMAELLARHFCTTHSSLVEVEVQEDKENSATVWVAP